MAVISFHYSHSITFSCIYCIMEALSLGQYIVQWPQSHSIHPSNHFLILSHAFIVSWKRFNISCNSRNVVLLLSLNHFFVHLLYHGRIYLSINVSCIHYVFITFLCSYCINMLCNHCVRTISDTITWTQSHFIAPTQSLSRASIVSWKHLSLYQCIVHPLCLYNFLVQLLYQYIDVLL